MQLVSYGAQDIYISGNPQITFWKVLYKRHTNFAMEAIEVTFNGQADFGRRVTAVISRNADLMYRTYVQVTLPQIVLTDPKVRFRWLNYVGHRLIKMVEIEIGGSRIDRQYGDWMQIWTQLTQPTGTQASFDDMVGNSADLVLLKDGAGVPLDATCAASEATNSCLSRAGTPLKTLYIPLQFWYCRNPGLAIPLIALQYHEVRINVEFEQNYNCCYADLYTGVNSLSTQTGINLGNGVTSVSQLQLVAASLYVDYVYLDTEERRRFAQQSHEYLIDQLQFTGDETVTASSNKIQMNFNHPVKELVWVVQRDSFVDCNSPPTPWISEALGQQPFNYTDDWSTEGIVTAVLGRGALATTGANGGVTTVPTYSPQAGSGSFTYGEVYIPGLGAASGSGLSTGSEIYNSSGQGMDDQFFEGTTNYLLAKVILASGVKCEGKNPVEVAKVQLNGQDRFDEREGRYFDKVQPWQHHTRTPSTGINVYSFALKPEEHQPSGTCNFSRIDKATLNLTLSVNTVRGQRTAKVRIYAVNYNVLRVMSGMGGLAYSN
jgi:Large eukaryotic DNA virus major capsid protein/Major capsid protein N-terminus